LLPEKVKSFLRDGVSILKDFPQLIQMVFLSICKKKFMFSVVINKGGNLLPLGTDRERGGHKGYGM
jgi:hypothetical protein